MIQRSKKPDKHPFVAWHCGLNEGHQGQHVPAENSTQVQANYAREDVMDDIHLNPPEILDREWIAPQDLSARTKLGRLARRLAAEQWEVHVGRSTYFEGDTLVKSTGVVKPGKTGEWVWVDAAHRPTKRLLTANSNGIRVNGKEITEEELW